MDPVLLPLKASSWHVLVKLQPKLGASLLRRCLGHVQLEVEVLNDSNLALAFVIIVIIVIIIDSSGSDRASKSAEPESSEFQSLKEEIACAPATSLRSLREVAAHDVERQKITQNLRTDNLRTDNRTRSLLPPPPSSSLLRTSALLPS